ncbi:hypothetical protein [Legionella sp. PC997]|uniref:hypothetical protein n=1 Tax=Legionella sp. PC997 TaxID=2755562 RepID=UPI0015FE176D|nr:hypothetical protein [Legionella sp. PC997]QMT61507.1 hypothetical protein HBNCFIEN_02911 [Legionella sp. PC997]
MKKNINHSKNRAWYALKKNSRFVDLVVSGSCKKYSSLMHEKYTEIGGKEMGVSLINGR